MAMNLNYMTRSVAALLLAMLALVSCHQKQQPTPERASPINEQKAITIARTYQAAGLWKQFSLLTDAPAKANLRPDGIWLIELEAKSIHGGSVVLHPVYTAVGTDGVVKTDMVMIHGGYYFDGSLPVRINSDPSAPAPVLTSKFGANHP